MEVINSGLDDSAALSEMYPYVHTEVKSEMLVSFSFFRDPSLIYLGRGFTRSRLEKQNFVTNRILLFIAESLKGGAFC